MPTSLTDKRRAALMQISKFLGHITSELDAGSDRVRALELAALAAKLSLPDNAALDLHEPMSEDVCVTRDGVSVIAPASTPDTVLVALFNIAKVVGGSESEMSLADIVAHVRGGVVRDGYWSHSVALHQVDVTLRGAGLTNGSPFPDGANLDNVVYRARVAIESMRATATALGKISSPPRTVGPEGA